MSLILKSVTKDKTVWRKFSTYEDSNEVPTKFYGYQNEQGKWIIEPEYEFATEFNSGIAVVAKECHYDGYEYEVINEKGEFLFSMNKDSGRDVPVGKDNSIRELQNIYYVKIKDGLIIVS